MAIARAQREREREQSRRAAQQVARDRWRRAIAADPAHAYLQRKQVGVHGLRQLGGRLLVPMRDVSGNLWAVQSITEEGDKRFLRGARKRGLYHAIGPQVEGVLCIAEGYATAASILEATGYPVAVAFDCSNLLPVARTLRGKFPRARFIVCADNDLATAERTGRNPGIEAALVAARAVGGVLASPSDFPTPGKDIPHARATATSCAA
jgi:putative DNA primase/helicase